MHHLTFVESFSLCTCKYTQNGWRERGREGGREGGRKGEREREWVGGRDERKGNLPANTSQNYALTGQNTSATHASVDNATLLHTSKLNSSK